MQYLSTRWPDSWRAVQINWPLWSVSGVRVSLTVITPQGKEANVLRTAVAIEGKVHGQDP